MKAIPTEYEGVRYRSKCEAQFAYWLHHINRAIDIYVCADGERKQRITQSGCTGFEYEPVLVNGFNCDFMVWRLQIKDRSVLPQSFITFIEYKPSRPTDTYISNWVEKVHHTLDSMESSGVDTSKMCFCIYYGSVYTESRGVVRVGMPERAISDSSHDWCGVLRDLMLSYRYDLQGSI